MLGIANFTSPWGYCGEPMTISCAVCWHTRSPTKTSVMWRKLKYLARGYGRSEEYAADSHGVDILRRAGYSKDTMLDSLIWVRSVAGSGGGGFLSTHPGIDDRIATIERLR